MHNPRVKRWQGLIASATATLLLLLAMAPSDATMKDHGGHGIIPFEVAGSQDRADEIMGEWGDEGQDAARESLWIDFGFLAAYGTFLTLAIATVRDRASPGAAPARRGRRVHSLVRRDRGGLRRAREHLPAADPGRFRRAFPVLAAIFAYIKFFFTSVSVAYLILGVPTSLVWRTAAPSGP